MFGLTKSSCGFLVLLGIAGCGGGPRLTPLDSDATILCFGDSLTSGVGAGQDESYPAVLAKELNCHVVNAGVPGEISSEGVARLSRVLRQHRPDLVILCHGGNDLLQKLPEEQIAAHLRIMIEQAQAQGAEVILLAVPKPGLFLKPPAFYSEVATACQIPLEGKALSAILQRRALKSDMIHPNAAGYRRLAERVAALIRSKS